MQRVERNGYIVHVIDDPRKEDPEEIRRAVQKVLYSEHEGGIVLNPIGKNKRETFSSRRLKAIPNANSEEISTYLSTVAFKIIASAQSATLFEFVPTDSH